MNLPILAINAMIFAAACWQIYANIRSWKGTIPQSLAMLLYIVAIMFTVFSVMSNLGL